MSSIEDELSYISEIETLSVGNATLYVYGDLCLLSLNMITYNIGWVIPEGYRPPAQVWNGVTYSTQTQDVYRITVQADGIIYLQKNTTGTGVDTLDSVRGELLWLRA